MTALNSTPFLDPEAGALADRRQLGRLIVRVPEGGEGAVLPGEPLEALDAPGHLGQQDLEAVADDQEVRVVSHVARRGPEVDDAFGARAGEYSTVSFRISVCVSASLFSYRNANAQMWGTVIPNLKHILNTSKLR